MFAAEFGTGQVFWSLLWFFMFMLWIWLVVAVFADIFRSQDLSGWSKALWSLLIIVLPYLGVFIYVIARGASMGDRALATSRRRDEMLGDFVNPAPASNDADQLEKLASLRSQGVIDDEEFRRMKGRLTAA
jgi:hypothetical protein